MDSPSIPHYLTLFLHQQSISSSPSLLDMATMLKSLSFFVILLIVNSLFFMETTEARPFNTMKSRNSAASRAIESFFDGLSLGEIKQSGPTPGVGNGFTNSKTLGGIKDGPSPCCGNKYTTGTHH